ncbi:unnamed protein product [Spodoptera littoralis]|uniref:Kazal-like domain-containing protein n=1 Tax=Spodoptera littoralis TaxID=7109 RepID=A0A9P0I7D1_SPOLI|nr:unnamed protein product [Spodoptera littoralis]CAH1641568.1 unnamed protein product [Spodoptera littoralis]
MVVFRSNIILNLFMFNICIKSAIGMRQTKKWNKPTDRSQAPPVKDSIDFVSPSTLGMVKHATRQGGNKHKQYMEGTTSKVPGRTTPEHISVHEPCDYLVINCHRAYQTGKVCGKSSYYRTRTFKNYCMLDYANCILRYEYFQILHMGECYRLPFQSRIRCRWVRHRFIFWKFHYECNYDDSKAYYPLSNLGSYEFIDNFPWPRV